MRSQSFTAEAPAGLQDSTPGTSPTASPPAAIQAIPVSSLPLGIAALLMATSSWGGMFLVSKDVLQHVDPVWFTLIRYSLSALFFSALLLPRGAGPWRRLRAHALPLALRGLAGFGLFSSLLLYGLAHSLPSHGAIIMATVPMSTQLLRWVLDGVRPARMTLFTSALALVGVAVVSGVLAELFSGHGQQVPSTLWGDTVALASTFGWIVYTRGAARFASLGVIEYTGLTALASWPLLLLGTLLATALGLVSRPSIEALQSSWPALAYVGIVSSALAVLAFNHGVRTLGAVPATAFMNMVPVSALLIGIAIGHAPSIREWMGLLMVVTALLLHTRASRSTYRAEPEPAPPTVHACAPRPAAMMPGTSSTPCRATR